MLGKHKLVGLSAVFGLLLLGFVVTFPHPAAAATGINPELSFEGKIVTSASGTNLPDGTYNMQFQIYTGCTNNTGTGCTNVWTENYFDTGTNVGGVTFTSGTFQVNLGSISAFGTLVPWNTYPLYLSMNIGNNTLCSSWPILSPTSCGGDGVMSPYILLTSSPYALNAGELGGLAAPTTTATASQCLQTASSVPYTQLVLGSCGGTTPTLQQAYAAGAGGSTPDILLTSAMGTLDIQDAYSPSIGTTLFEVTAGASSGIGTTLFTVGNTGNTTVETSTNSATALQVENNNGVAILSVNTLNPSVQVTGALTDSTETVADSALIQGAGAGTSLFAVDNNLGVPILTAGTNNLLINGDFESGTTGWAGATAGGSVAQNNTNPTYVYSGASSLAITTTTTAHTGAQVTTFNGPMAIGTYTLSFYAKAASGFATLEASFNNLGTNNCLSSAAVTTSFTYFSCTYTTTGVTTAVSIGSSGTTALTFYIDAVDVTLTPNLLTNPGFENGTTGWSATTNSTVSWNQNRQYVYLGQASLKVLTTAATSGATYSSSNYIATQSSSGSAYTLSFYAMATSAITLSASLGSGTCTLAPTGAVTGGFTFFSCTATTTSAPVITINSATAATFYIDSVQLINGSSLLPYNIGQIQLRGIIDSPATFQSTSNSTIAFQIQNTSNASLFTVDTTDGNVNIDNTGAVGTVQIGNTTGGVLQTINIGNNTAASSTDAITIGNLLGASATTIQSGTSGAISIQDGGGGINIGAGATADTIQLGTTSGSVTQNIYVGYNGTTDIDNVRIGNTYGGSQVVIQGGTGANAIQINPGIGGEVQIATNGVGGTQTLQLGLGIGSAVGATQDIYIGNNNAASSVDAIQIGNLLTTSSTLIQGGTTATGSGAISIQSGALGLLLLQSVNNGPITTGTGVFTIGGNIALSGTTAKTIAATDSGGVTMSNTSGALTVSTITSGTLSVTSAGILALQSTAANLTLDTSSTNTITLGATNAAIIQIGSATTSGTQHLLQLNAFSTFADSPACNTTTSEGALYYSTASNSVRSCVNGTWQDLVSTDVLSAILFGVVPDSGAANQGDLAGVTGLTDGPCKVFVGTSLTTVSWNSCEAYSGGRKVYVTAGANVATTNSTAGDFQHLCLTAASNQPGLSTAAVETGNLSTSSMVSTTAPVLCLADIKFAAANNTITDIYDTRTFTTTQKEFATAITTAPVLGSLVVAGTTTPGSVIAAGTLQMGGIRGVVVASTGAISTNTVNVIIATTGPAWVKSITETNAVGGTVQATATAGYAGDFGTAVATNVYSVLGLAESAWTGATTCAISSNACAGSVLTFVTPR